MSSVRDWTTGFAVIGTILLGPMIAFLTVVAAEVLSSPSPFLLVRLGLDQAATQRGGGLLILAGEVVFADGPPDAVEDFERLAAEMQSVALPAPKASRSPDGLDLVHLVSFGNRRKAENLPGFLREDVADGIVFVQPRHDQDDGTTALVVLPAVESVIVPVVGGLSLRVGERLLRLQRIVDQDDVGTAFGEHAAD
jgi:hypothetical protein